MYLDVLASSLSRLCDEMGLTYKDASRRCHCSPQHFANIIHQKSVPSITMLENLCDGFGKTPNYLLQITSDVDEVSYRTPMRVETARAYRQGSGTTVFPVCPRCNISMEREYQAFCDRCGQHLSWRGYHKCAIPMTHSEISEP